MLRLLLLVMCSACIVETTHATTTVTAQWTIGTLASSTTTGCMGLPVARLVAQPLDGGDATVTDFDCEAGSGVSAAVAPGQYELAIEIRAADGAVFARSVGKSVDLTNGDDQAYAAAILTDAGYAQVAWTVACQGIDVVRVTAIRGAARFVDVFPCEAHQGLTHALPAGAYAFTVDALAAGQVIGTAGDLGTRSIEAPNRVTDLGTVAIR